MSGNTIITILILAVIAVVAFITVRNYRKQLKEGCCGAGGDDETAIDNNIDRIAYITLEVGELSGYLPVFTICL